MKWTIFDDAWVVLAVGLLAMSLALGSCDTAEACNLCSRTYRVYHAPKAVVQKQVVEKHHYIPQQTVIFNNAYPSATPGQTSYQSFAAPFSPSASGLISLATAQATASSQTASYAREQAATEASLAALAIERDKIVAISEHLRAGLSGGGGGSQTLILQIGADGTIKQVTPEQVAPGQAGQPQLAAGSVIAARCAKCHSGAQPEAGFYLDGSSAITGATAWSAVKAINAGKMPPASEEPLTADEKQAILDELEELEKEN